MTWGHVVTRHNPPDYMHRTGGVGAVVGRRDAHTRAAVCTSQATICRVQMVVAKRSTIVRIVVIMRNSAECGADQFGVGCETVRPFRLSFVSLPPRPVRGRNMRVRHAGPSARASGSLPGAPPPPSPDRSGEDLSRGSDRTESVQRTPTVLSLYKNRARSTCECGAPSA